MSVQSSNKVTFSSSSSKRADFDDDIDITYEEERFDSGELVTDFIKQTSEHTAESIKRIASTLKEEETSSSGTIVFQNSDADLTDGETLTIPSLSERLEQNRTSPSQRPRNIPPKYADIQANLNLSDSSVEEINVASKKDEFVEKTVLYSTVNNNMLIPTIMQTRTSSSTVTQFHSTTRMANPDNQAQQFRRCQRSVSWDGQESSPETNTGFWRSASLHYETRCYLYIQMELCCSTLRHWMDERNQAIKDGQSKHPKIILCKIPPSDIVNLYF